MGYQPEGLPAGILGNLDLNYGNHEAEVSAVLVDGPL